MAGKSSMGSGGGTRHTSRQSAPRVCPQQQYWDSLVRRCVPCSAMCHLQPPLRCSRFCESLKCTKAADTFYDELLRRCIPCSQLCGQHPSQCGALCQGHATGWTPLRQLVGSKVVKPMAGEEHRLLVASLLGVGLGVLIFSLSIAVVMLWRLSRRAAPRKETSGQPPEGPPTGHRPASDPMASKIRCCNRRWPLMEDPGVRPQSPCCERRAWQPEPQRALCATCGRASHSVICPESPV
ncbi:tumor necrosis factor receptor superfamily member 13B isoform X1 [Erpetoichthys calabaricus]|uniref:tumor necrosis factor receptor superfamily member 13B isoform X1 n=1 Tax=Erpetoichthys calabaricus TaxID=27687 RepID=UPI0022341A69|nr:tumor necrosis factor receptor superfamily member 13B isoform X1 [Erpetoichthys calabaricus]